MFARLVAGQHVEAALDAQLQVAQPVELRQGPQARQLQPPHREHQPPQRRRQAGQAAYVQTNARAQVQRQLTGAKTRSSQALTIRLIDKAVLCVCLAS